MPAVKSYHQIWSGLSAETRVAAASAMLADPEEKSSRTKALNAIATKRKIRLKTVLQLAPAKQAAHLAGITIDESLASAMVRCYLLRDHRPMLKIFLDALGIPNVNGESDEMPSRPPDPDRLERAVASVAKFPRDVVNLYFDALAAHDRSVWGGLCDFASEPGAALTPNRTTPEKASPQQEKPQRPASRRHAPDDRDLSPLDEMTEAAILGWASGTEGALETGKIVAALDELLRLNAARPRSYFHIGLLDASQERSREAHFDVRDEEHRLWYLCGAVAAHARAGRHERIAQLYENEKMGAFGSQLVPRSLRAVEPIFEALCLTNKAGVAARFLSPKMLAYAGMFETTLNWGTRLLHHGNHLEAEMLLDVIERSLPHFAAGEIATEKLQVLERRRAHCFRLKRDFHRSEAILAKLAVQPEVKNLSPVLTDLAIIRAHFRGLFDIIIPVDTGRVIEFCRAMHRIEDALLAALRVPGEKSHAQYCLGVLALVDTEVRSKQSLPAAELLESSVVYILSRGTTYETGGLPQRARFYLALALAETLDETRTKFALELFVESLRMGFSPPAHLLRRFIDALSIADSESARQAAETALAELRREKYQRPKVRDAGKKWKLTYWDYSTGEPKHRSKVWAKSIARTQREAQRLADAFIEEVNVANNDPRLYSSDENTLAGLQKKCSELTWPHLKKSTLMNYEYFFNKYLIPRLGEQHIDELNTVELQAYFNSFIGKLAPRTIKNMHAALRAVLGQAVVWGMIDRNPAIGIKLPKQKQVKAPVLLTFPEIKRVIDWLPEPTRTIVILIVFASMRVGEALALRWNDILSDRIIIDERLYDHDLDEPKTLHGNREVPFDERGIIQAALAGIWAEAKFRKADDFVFATRTGTPTERRNVLRHLKDAAKALGLGKTIDFRSFRTMHASLMRRTGARAEVTRDNMGHSECATSLEIYGRTWWDERAAAVSAVVDLVMKSDEKKDAVEQQQTAEKPRQMLFQPDSIGAPTSAPAPKSVQAKPGICLEVIEKNGRGERI